MNDKMTVVINEQQEQQHQGEKGKSNEKEQQQEQNGKDRIQSPTSPTTVLVNVDDSIDLKTSIIHRMKREVDDDIDRTCSTNHIEYDLTHDSILPHRKRIRRDHSVSNTNHNSTSSHPHPPSQQQETLSCKNDSFAINNFTNNHNVEET
ncbi:unnamed protein product, partial [Didymodactylos carnosus]